MSKIFRIYKNIFADYSLLICAACSLIFGGINFYYIIFAATVHELAHFLCACILGYKPESFIIRGFGIELSGVRGRFSPSAVIMVAISGPAASLLLAAVGYAACNYMMFAVNISVAFLNLLPAYPLDGGQVLYGFLMQRINRKTAKRTVKYISRVFAVIMMLAGLCVLTVTKYNFSLLYVGVFIFFSSRGELYNPVLEVAAAQKGEMKKCSIYEIEAGRDIMDAADSLPCNSIGAVRDKNGSIIGAVTPYQLYMSGKKGNLKEFLKNKESL